MIKYTGIKGALIVNEDESINGVVEDCLLNIKLLKVCSLLITINGIISSCALIPFWKIKSFGEKIMFTGEMIAVKRDEIDGVEHSAAGNYFGKEIVYPTNEKIGDMADVVIEEETGRIRAIIVSRGFVDDVVDGRRVVIIDEKTVFDKDKVIVQESETNIVNEISLKRFLRG